MTSSVVDLFAVEELAALPTLPVDTAMLRLVLAEYERRLQPAKEWEYTPTPLWKFSAFQFGLMLPKHVAFVSLASS